MNWPSGYEPGFTDHFASNEVIVAGLDAARVWTCLNDTSRWPSYYSNARDIRFPDGSGPQLEPGTRFCFSTFGFAAKAEVTEWQPPSEGRPGRLSWHGWVDGERPDEHELDVLHAWIVEDITHGRVRILTQETQNGKPAQEVAAALPDALLNGHQEWLVGLVKCARSDAAASKRPATA